MPDAASLRYGEINSWASLESLIEGAEAEGLHLEAKAPSDPRLSRDQRESLAKAVSGFSNTAGGIVIWGMSTTRHAHSGLDVLTQIEPIGSCRQFMQQVQRLLPTLTTPPVLTAVSKVLTARLGDTRGVVLTHIPHRVGEPVLSNSDNVFYWRSGDEFRAAPYEIIQRLFAFSESPDLVPYVDDRLVTMNEDGRWSIPIGVQNNSRAIAEHAHVSIVIENPQVCESISAVGFTDASDINPGSRIFMSNLSGVVHRSLNRFVGTMYVKMRVGRRPHRRLRFSIRLFANRMQARQVHYVVELAKKGFAVVGTKPSQME